ncbi:MAG: 4Fe-4S binding protein [Candidatus Lokiarchaeota archaeon]|nr:4Fe-4S binding protein [Candidatus Lokiarchaeota archaeon]
MSEQKEDRPFPIITVTRRIVQILSFFAVNLIALELIFSIDLSVFTDQIIPYPFIHTPRDAWSTGAGMFEFMLFSLARGEVPYLLMGLFFLIVLITARFFCGWVCPVGFIQDILAAIPGKPKRVKIETDKSLKKVKTYIIVFLIIVMIFFGAIWNINQQLWVEWKFALGQFLERPLAGFSLSEFLFNTLHNKIQIIWQGTGDPLFDNTWQVLGFIFYIVILILSAYYPRFYCRTLCPYGAAAAFVSDYSALRLGRNPVKCVGRRECGICEKVCPMQIRILDEPFEGFTGEGECILCGRCKEACPYDAIELNFG